MRTPLFLAATSLLLGCGPDFSGENKVYAFNTTLSRPSVPWTPATSVAVGETFTVSQGSACFLNCPGPYTGLHVVGNGLAFESPARFTTTGPGSASIITNGPSVDQFRVNVEEPEGLTLREPLELSRPLWAHLRNPDGGPAAFPEVGDDEIVIGPDAGFYLDITLVNDAGAMLASSAGLLVSTSTSSETTAIAAQLDGRLLDITTGSSGTTARTTISRADGGLARTWDIRVAGPEEIATIELVQITSGSAIVRAIVRRSDGGVFFEPPIEWTIEGALEEDYTRYRTGLRRRRDVRMFKDIYDAGTPRAIVTANDITASIELDLTEQTPQPDPPAPPAMRTTGCAGCTSASSASLLLGALVLFARRRRTCGQRAK